jgi:hypothetical protein
VAMPSLVRRRSLLTTLDSLVATLRGLVLSGPTATWPPQYFTAADFALISDRAIRELVFGEASESTDNNIYKSSFISNNSWPLY